MMAKLSYFELLSGRPVYINRVGRVKSPTINEVLEVGEFVYNLYLNMLSWDKEALLRFYRTKKCKGTEKLENPKVDIFDVISLIKEAKELYGEVLSFFITDEVQWSEEHRCYIVFAAGDETKKPIGVIQRENFEEVRKTILKFNFIGLENDDTPITHSTEKSKEAWEKVQMYLSQQSKSGTTQDNPRNHLANIISKVCAVHPSYNLFNIYDLTIFQLYDSFFQLGYIRSVNLNERIFSNHGGESFEFEKWLDPILKKM